MKHLFFLAAVFLFISCESETQGEKSSYQTHYEASGGEETATYKQTIDYYMGLAREFPQINIQTIGKTDSGLPLHTVTFNPDGDFNYENINKSKKIIENEFNPLSDMRSSSKYRRLVSQNLLERFYLEVRNNRSETIN